MGQRKVKVLWSFPAVLTLPFFVCLFQCLPVCYNPLIILEFWKIRFWQFLLIFSIFPQRDWPLELPNFFFFFFCWSQSWKGDMFWLCWVCGAYGKAQYTRSTDRYRSLNFSFLGEEIWAVNRDWEVFTLLWKIQGWVRSGRIPANVTVEEATLEAES